MALFCPQCKDEDSTSQNARGLCIHEQALLVAGIVLIASTGLTVFAL